MRIAILADIHGNLPAFEAALEHTSTQRVDQLVIAGDVIIGAPDCAACWRLAQSLGCPLLRGNHERYASTFGTPEAPAAWAGEQYAPLHWAVAQLSEAERRRMAELPVSLRLPDAPDLLLVHASERNDTDTVSAHTPEAQLGEMFPQAEERILVRAHNHVGQVRLWEQRLIITASSAGLPLDGHPTAQYLLLEQRREGWRIQHQSVPYDLDAAIRRFHDSGYLAATGPMGRLYYHELVTASQQLVPFNRLYARWLQQGEISLGRAVERFLNGF